jgi:rod shape-determining protein MreD
MQLLVLNIARFFFVVFLQIFVINNFDLGNISYLVAPVVYIVYILTFPNHYSKYVLLLVAFILGITIDIFSNTYGIHASACLIMAYSRTFMTKQLEAQNTFDGTFNLTIHTIEKVSYIKYLTVLTFVFLFWLFLLEEFSFSNLHVIILKTILSTILSVTLILIGQYLLFKKQKI